MRVANTASSLASKPQSKRVEWSGTGFQPVSGVRTFLAGAVSAHEPSLHRDSFLVAHAPFPLTPALSPRERENRRLAIPRTGTLGFDERRYAWLPLPKGEGWGEGERILRPLRALEMQKFRCAWGETISGTSLPEGDLKIARQFTAGLGCDIPSDPKGRVNPSSVLDLFLSPAMRQQFFRPFGTCCPYSTIPPLKGWAIVNSPFGRWQPIPLSWLFKRGRKNAF